MLGDNLELLETHQKRVYLYMMDGYPETPKKAKACQETSGSNKKTKKDQARERNIKKVNRSSDVGLKGSQE